MDNYKKIHETALELSSYLSRYESLEELNQDYVIENRFDFNTLSIDFVDISASENKLSKSNLFSIT